MPYDLECFTLVGQNEGIEALTITWFNLYWPE
jgi:hypothetical protein